MWLPMLITVLVGYFLGNLNGAVSMSVLQGKEDVRSKGSGNAGLTNFIRNFGVARAVMVVLIDVSKAVVACLAGMLMFQGYGYEKEGMILGAVAVSLGHDFPALLGFRGGKGILSGFAIAMTIDYRCGLIILGVFAVSFLITRYVSVSSILGAIAFCVSFIILYQDRIWVMLGGVFIGAMAVFMHRTNIQRLIKGTESRVTFGKKEQHP